MAAKFWLDWIDQTGLENVRKKHGGSYINNRLWDLVFERCTDPMILERAIRLLKSYINNTTDQKENMFVTDTLANILYKAGRTEEAIAMEERAANEADRLALEASTKSGRRIAADSIYRETIEKMRKGVPTWERTKA